MINFLHYSALVLSRTFIHTTTTLTHCILLLVRLIVSHSKIIAEKLCFFKVFLRKAEYSSVLYYLACCSTHNLFTQNTWSTQFGHQSPAKFSLGCFFLIVREWLKKFNFYSFFLFVFTVTLISLLCKNLFLDVSSCCMCLW